MTGGTTSRLRGALLRGIVVAVLAWAAATPLAAQTPEPARPDTVPPDTAIFVVPPEQLPADTLAGDTAAVVPDSLRLAPAIPRFPDPRPSGWSTAVWEWNREALLRFHGVSLLDLVQQVPGLTITRSGVFGRPAGVAAWGLGGGRLRVFLDGYELDPLASATIDLQRLALVDLGAVRIVRGLAETRIEIEQFRLADARAFSQIEAATGNDQRRFLRALFARPIGNRNVLALGFDVVNTEGLPLRQPFNVTTGVARWTHQLSPRAGLQLEYRQSGVERQEAAFVESAGYRDLIFRGRAVPFAGLALEGTLGRSWRTAEEADSLGVELAANRAAFRALWERGPGWLEGTARLRFGAPAIYPAPNVDLLVRSGFHPAAGIEVDGSARLATAEADGGGSVSGTELQGGVRLGPMRGLTLFGSAATGMRGVESFQPLLTPLPGDTLAVDTAVGFAPLSSQLAAIRLGAEWARWGAIAGAAFVTLNADRIVPFGLPFDLRVEPVAPEVQNLIEAYVSAPLFVPQLRFQGNYSRGLGDVTLPYLPVEQGRAAVDFHNLFYTGNLEVTSRLEAVGRGGALVPLADGTAFGATSDPYTLINFYLQIRIVDVRAFLLVDNLLAVQPADLPGRTFPGTRVLYGVRWHFFN